MKKVPLTPRTIAAGIVIVLVLMGIGYTLVPSSKGVESTSTARLVVTTRPAGARVKVDGVDRGLSPVTVNDLRQGSVALVNIELAGYADSGGAVSLAQAENSVEFPLKAFPCRVGFSVIPAQAMVLIDGKPLAERASFVELPQGRHTIEFALSGYNSDTRTVEAKEGHRENWKIVLQPQMSLLKLDGLAGVDVKVDGASWGGASTRQRSIQVGRHSLEAHTTLGLRCVDVEVENQPTNELALETALFVERQLMAQAPRSGNVMLVRSDPTRGEAAQSFQFTGADSTFSLNSYSARSVTIEVEDSDGKSCRMTLTAPSSETSLQTGRPYSGANTGSRYAQMRFTAPTMGSIGRHSYYVGSGVACFTIHRAFVDARGAIKSIEATFADFDRLGRGKQYGYVRCSRPVTR